MYHQFTKSYINTWKKSSNAWYHGFRIDLHACQPIALSPLLIGKQTNLENISVKMGCLPAKNDESNTFGEAYFKLWYYGKGTQFELGLFWNPSRD